MVNEEGGEEIWAFINVPAKLPQRHELQDDGDLIDITEADSPDVVSEVDLTFEADPNYTVSEVGSETESDHEPEEIVIQPQPSVGNAPTQQAPNPSQQHHEATFLPQKHPEYLQVPKPARLHHNQQPQTRHEVPLHRKERVRPIRKPKGPKIPPKIPLQGNQPPARAPSMQHPRPAPDTTQIPQLFTRAPSLQHPKPSRPHALASEQQRPTPGQPIYTPQPQPASQMPAPPGVPPPGILPTPRPPPGAHLAPERHPGGPPGRHQQHLERARDKIFGQSKPGQPGPGLGRRATPYPQPGRREPTPYPPRPGSSRRNTPPPAYTQQYLPQKMMTADGKPMTEEEMKAKMRDWDEWSRERRVYEHGQKMAALVAPGCWVWSCDKE